MNLRPRRAWLSVALATCAAAAPSAIAAPPGPPVTFAPIGTYATGLAGEDQTAAETAAVSGDRMFVTNTTGNSLDIVDITDPASPSRIARIDLAPYGAGPNSVDVNGNLVAVAVESAVATDPGAVVFLRPDGTHVATVPAGALPDMLAFNGAGNRLLVANEGEPSSYGQADSVDPEGTLTVIDVASLRGASGRPPAVQTVTFTDFDAGGPRNGELPAGIRLNGPGARVSQDIEPEYVTWDHSGTTAWVTLQENNAVAEIDTRRARVTRIRALGTIDHSQAGSGFDASDRDDAISIVRRPVRGMFMPDAIAAFRVRGTTYLVTANEGDARDYDGFSDEARVGSRTLDPTAFPDAAALKDNASLGRLNVSTTDGVNAAGAHTALFGFGTRSATIWTAGGTRVWDSGDAFERTVAAVQPGNFNAGNDDNTFDSRSDNKGPEPEGVAVGEVDGRQYAFVGLERAGGFMVVDVSDPGRARVVQWANNRDFSADPAATDNGPEIIRFIPASRGRAAMVMVSNEVSGTVTFYAARSTSRTGTVLSLIHNNDGESSILPIPNTTPAGPVDTGGVAAFKTVLDREERAARVTGNSVLTVYAGDAFLASSTLACSLPPRPADTPVYDAVAQRQMGYDAHILGNHEFDFGPAFLRRFIDGFAQDGRLTQPFLSANLDASGEPELAGLRDADGLIVGTSSDGRVVARSLVHTDPATGQTFGVVGATTPLLPTISSPGGVRVTSTDIPSTATVVQREVDRLRGMGVSKVILVSHLQDVANDRQLIPLLRHVDVAVAGGGDELLANPDTPLLPGESQTVAGAYPLLVADRDGRNVPVVTTAGNYKYVGRLDVRFDAEGRVTEVLTSSGPRRVIPAAQTTPGVLDGVTDAAAPNAGITRSVVAPVNACLTEFSRPILGTEVALDTSRAGNRSRETNTGNSITDGYLASYDRYGPALGLPARGPANPVVAVQNGGGIRQNAGNVVPAGPVPGTISRRNTLDVLAFLTNAMTVVRDVTPADLKLVFERSGASLPGEGGQFLQVAGMTVTFSTAGTAQAIATDGTVTTPGSRVVDITLADGRKVVEAGAVVPGAPNVTLVTNSFTAAGGDNYPWLAANAAKVNLPATYEQAWVEYLLTLPPVTVGGTAYPTIPASNPDYATANPGRRITIAP